MSWSWYWEIYMALIAIRESPLYWQFAEVKEMVYKLSYWLQAYGECGFTANAIGRPWGSFLKCKADYNLKLIMLQIRNLFKPKSDAKELSSKKVKAWKPLGRLPYWLSQSDLKEQHNALKRSNRYLEYMENRIKKLKSEGETEKAAIIWAILLKRSATYQLCLYHRTLNNWYWKLSENSAKKLLKNFMNKCRKWDMALTLERFYLSKPEGTRISSDHVFHEGEKFRPIGAPTFESRMISKCLNDLTYFLLEDSLNNFQHAYKHERGTHTALIEVWLRIVVLKHTHIREFDFKGYFNNIRIGWVVAFLRKENKILAYWINYVYNLIEYKFDRRIEDLPEEAEIGVVRVKHKLKKPKVVRTGLPQGLSVSPILATAVMACLPELSGLVMYADDGLIIRKTEENDKEVEDWFSELKILGLETDPEKSGVVKNNFKFLGVTFNLESEEVEFKGKTYSWKNKDTNKFETAQEIYQWFKLVGQKYGKKPQPWTWNIHPNSMIRKYNLFFKGNIRIGKGSSFWEDLRNIYNKLLDVNTYKGYRLFIGRGIYHISSCSTKCCSELQVYQKDLRLVKVKSFKWEEKPTDEIYRNKGKYEERRSGISVTWNSYWLARRRYITNLNLTEEEKKLIKYTPSL